MTRAILAFESSCDETAVALVSDQGEVLSHQLASQIALHNQFGGVVPELASRNHFEVIDTLTSACLREAPQAVIEKVAATLGPGLIGPLLVGASYAEGFALGRGLPFVGVHHLRGHLASCLLGSPSSLQDRAQELFPALVLLVSGGHTQILEVGPTLKARRLADTADDAAGECFDKSAKLMGLPYPGGPELEKIARKLRPEEKAQAESLARAFPRPRSSEGFSFSGLKTAVRLRLEKEPALKQSSVFCWALQEVIAQILVQGLEAAWTKISEPPRNLLFCGGVSANLRLRAAVESWAAQKSLRCHLPPLRYCTDNAVMIGACAWVQSPELALSEPIARVSLEGPA